MDLDAAMHANYLAALGRISSLAPGSATARIGPWFVLDAATDVPQFNGAALVEAPEDPASAIALASEWFDARGASFRLILRARADRKTAEAALTSGAALGHSEPIMALSPPPASFSMPPGLEISRVDDLAGATTYASVEGSDDKISAAITRRALELPGTTLWLGSCDGQPVAHALGLLLDDVVGVYNVFVRPECRRRGFGAAVTLAAISHARALGATHACLSATELGRPVYERIGFREVDRYLSFWPGGAPD